MSLTKGGLSTCCAWLCKNEILQLPTKSLCEDFMCQVSLFRHWYGWSNCRPGILAFRLSLLLRTMCWSFCMRSFCTLTWYRKISYRADMVSALCPTPKSWGFPHCLWSPMSVPGSCNCAGILVTKLGHHQNPSPVASSASTHTKFCSFSLHLSLKVFNTIFLQFLPPEIITRYYPDFDKSC